ncbi:HAD family hydrolase [Olsenella uli]|uniref:HAD hydrolase-like protein n=1 Tax=Olsenella uli TaxID=133926 RepID=UPI0019580C70|nr:HAD family hydrolase [Olsenella uli]
MTRPKLVIFDLDGTLLDTVEDVADCFNAALCECGFPAKSLDDIIALVGGDLETIVSKLLPLGASQKDVAEVKDCYRRIYAASEKPKTRPYDGIPELLGELKANGVDIAVNTNKGQDLAEKCLASAFPNMKIPVSGLVDGIPHKPDPCGVNVLLDAGPYKAEEAVYVGDGVSDALTASNANMRFVYCAWGQGDERRVLAVSSDAPVARNARELKSILMER